MLKYYKQLMIFIYFHTMEYCTILYSLVLALFISLLIIKLVSPRSSYKNSEPVPPSPPSLPIIGHLHLFKKPLHRTLARLSSVHGPAVLLRFGSRPVLVVSSLPLAEECFTKNDLAFASRPQLPSSRSLTYNYATLASAPYGPHWRNVRRIATVELLSSGRLNSLSDVRSSEIKSLIYNLFLESKHNEFRMVELKTRLFGVAYNVMMRTIAGKRCYGEDEKGSEEARRFREMVEEALTIIGASNVSDFLPVLRLVDFGGVKRKMKRLETKRDALMQGLIDELRLRSKEAEENRGEKKKKKSMLEVLLELQEEAPEYYSDEIIKAMVVTLFVAGTDTSSETIEWAMTLLLNHPETLEKARAEIDSAVGEDRLLQEHDLSDLPYLNAIINETLRLRPAAPLLLPHESLQECTVGGYRVQRSTMLLVNVWAIHRDPKVWADPLEFRPERFVDREEGGGGGGSSKILPFGMGRRRCPGDGLAMRLIGSALGTMIQCFEWKRIGEELIDMEETGGLTLHKANPLQLMYKPRQSMVGVLSQI